MPRLTSKGQVTIPKPIRDRLGLKPGAEVEFKLGRNGQVIVSRKTAIPEEIPESRFAALRGTLDLGMTTDEFMRFIRGDPDE